MKRERPKSLLSDLPAARLEQVMELYAPMVYDENDLPIGREPKFGVITLEQAQKLLGMPLDQSSDGQEKP